MAEFSAMWSLSQLDWRLRLAQQRQDRRWQVQAATADATGLTCFKFRFLRRPQREQRLSFSKKAFSSTEVIQMQNVMKSLMRGHAPLPLKRVTHHATPLQWLKANLYKSLSVALRRTQDDYTEGTMLGYNSYGDWKVPRPKGIGKGKTMPFSLRLDEELASFYRRKANEHGISVSEFLTNACARGDCRKCA